MKRIKQLLSKGIDNLDDAELTELTALLAPEELAKLSDEDIAEVKRELAAAADVLIEIDDNSDPVIDALERVIELLDAVDAIVAQREQEAGEAAARKAALRDRIRGTEASEANENEGELPRDDADESGEPIVVVEEIPADELPVAAGVVIADNVVTASNSGTVITRVNARRPVSHNPRPRSEPRQAAITAAAGLPGVGPGVKLDSDDKLFNAINSAVQLARGADPDNELGARFKMPVFQLRSEIPEDLQLTRDAERNERIIDARTNMGAITAAGGACAPVPYSYDLPTVGDDAQPVRDALVRFGAQRAGVSFFTPPTITDVSGTGATTSAVSEWTYANDVNPTAPTTKPYLRIDCGSNTPTVTRVNAIVTAFETGNMLDRWFPELIQAYMKLMGVYAARFSEAKRLATIASFSKTVTHGQILGSASDIFPALDQLISGMRYRHRIAAGVSMRVIGFEWVRQSILTDLIRRGNGDRPLEERLAMAIGQINSWFAARNCNITWSQDFQFGVALGSPGGPLAGVQNPGPVIGYPSVARFYVFQEGSVLYLDGGEFRMGVMRDVTLVRKNDFAFFAETFENVVYHGVPGEAYVYDIDICSNGGYSSALDIAPCVTNS